MGIDEVGIDKVGIDEVGSLRYRVSYHVSWGLMESYDISMVLFAVLYCVSGVL